MLVNIPAGAKLRKWALKYCVTTRNNSLTLLMKSNSLRYVTRCVTPLYIFEYMTRELLVSAFRWCSVLQMCSRYLAEFCTSVSAVSNWPRLPFANSSTPYSSHQGHRLLILLIGTSSSTADLKKQFSSQTTSFLPLLLSRLTDPRFRQLSTLPNFAVWRLTTYVTQTQKNHVKQKKYRNRLPRFHPRSFDGRTVFEI